MAFLRELRTQGEEFWREDFSVREHDIEGLYATMLEDGRPRSLTELSKEVMDRRISRERQVLARDAERGELYRPSEDYEVGQVLVFPVFDFAVGKVVGSRPGQNPRFGTFSVIQVEMEGNGGVRDFASGFTLPHKLSRETAASGLAEDLSTDEVFVRYGHYVEPLLETALLGSEEFSRLESRWLLKGLLPEIHVGHLNIAEAMIYEAIQPMSTEELLPELDLGMEFPQEAQILALNQALEQDDRFDDVSTSGSPLWYLVGLLPEAVAQPPDLLKVAFSTRGGEPLHRESLEFVEELADEADEIGDEAELVSQIGESVAFVLNYPHFRAGTVPLTHRISPLFPHSQNPRIRISFLDARTREEMPGWVVRDRGYVWGLRDWYEKIQIPVGGYVELARTDDPFIISVNYARHSRRGQWVRVASATDNRVTIQMGRASVSVKHDRHLLLSLERAEDVDVLWSTRGTPGASMLDILQEVFPELSKLSGQGLVHAKTLYSAVNLLHRCGAVPIFSELATQACFDPMGDGNWVFDSELVGQTYETLDDMMARPKSKRVDFIRDQVHYYEGMQR